MFSCPLGSQPILLDEYVYIRNKKSKQRWLVQHINVSDYQMVSVSKFFKNDLSIFVPCITARSHTHEHWMTHELGYWGELPGHFSGLALEQIYRSSSGFNSNIQESAFSVHHPISTSFRMGKQHRQKETQKLNSAGCFKPLSESKSLFQGANQNTPRTEWSPASRPPDVRTAFGPLKVRWFGWYVVFLKEWLQSNIENSSQLNDEWKTTSCSKSPTKHELAWFSKRCAALLRNWTILLWKTDRPWSLVIFRHWKSV